VFALGVSVDVGDSGHAWVAFGVHETGVLSENLPRRPPHLRWAQQKKKPADDQPADKGLRLGSCPD
jgi:hypothetical protein